MSVLKADFVSRRITSLPYVPTEWAVGSGYHYQLNMKMCQIGSLDYNFTWAKHSSDSMLDQPHKILQLDISLNDISSLDHRHLSPFSQLRILNASLNRINRYVGVETLKHLRILDLSHNNITNLQGLGGCVALTVLNLSMNEIDDISNMPSLGQLRELHISNNKLRSLDGVQAFPALQELHAQRNLVTDLIPLSSNFRLRILNIADNHITSFTMTLEVLQDLKRLQALTLQGNPVDQDHHYQSKIIAATSVTLLDNINVRPHPKHQGNYNQNLVSIKEYTRQAFLENISEKRHLMEENVRFLQKRILALQDDFKDYEVKAHSDLESCLRHMDTLSMDDAYKYSSDLLGDKIPIDAPPPAQQNTGRSDPRHTHRDEMEPPGRHRPPVEAYPRPGGIISPTGYKHPKGDYKDIRTTDEVLRCAYNELAREKETRSDW